MLPSTHPLASVDCVNWSLKMGCFYNNNNENDNNDDNCNNDNNNTTCKRDQDLVLWVWLEAI